MTRSLHSLLCLTILVARTVTAQDTFPVVIQVDAATSKGELHRIWRYFGADEPNYAYMKDGRKLLGQLGELAHRSKHLLDSGKPVFRGKQMCAHPIFSWGVV